MNYVTTSEIVNGFYTIVIYSCITNGYDEIPDEHYYDPDIKYVMFTDNTVKEERTAGSSERYHVITHVIGEGQHMLRSILIKYFLMVLRLYG